MREQDPLQGGCRTAVFPPVLEKRLYAGFGRHGCQRSDASPIDARASWDVALLQTTDRSNVPISNDVADFMEHLCPQVLILLGIAGGLCEDEVGRDGIRPGDVLIADEVAYVEFLKLENGKALLRSYAIDHPSVPLRKNVCMPISKTFSILNNLGEAIKPPDAQAQCKIHIGDIVSGEKVFGDLKSHVQQGLLQPFDKALAVDMELIGMARAVCNGRDSFWCHPRYVVIRGISDLVADDDNGDQRTKPEAFRSFRSRAGRAGVRSSATARYRRALIWNSVTAFSEPSATRPRR